MLAFCFNRLSGAGRDGSNEWLFPHQRVHCVGETERRVSGAHSLFLENPGAGRRSWKRTPAGNRQQAISGRDCLERSSPV